MPPPSTPAPRPPTFSSLQRLTSRSPSIQEHSSTTPRSNTRQQDQEEEIALHPLIKNRVLPLAIEPTCDQSAAIATVLIQLPKCTSEPRSQQNVTAKTPQPSLMSLNEGASASWINDGSGISSTPSRKGRSKYDIVPITVGGGNSQTLSFGCVLVSSSQSRSKFHVRNSKGVLNVNRSGQHQPNFND